MTVRLITTDTLLTDGEAYDYFILQKEKDLRGYYRVLVNDLDN